MFPEPTHYRMFFPKTIMSCESLCATVKCPKMVVWTVDWIRSIYSLKQLYVLFILYIMNSSYCRCSTVCCNKRVINVKSNSVLCQEGQKSFTLTFSIWKTNLVNLRFTGFNWSIQYMWTSSTSYVVSIKPVVITHHMVAHTGWKEKHVAVNKATERLLVVTLNLLNYVFIKGGRQKHAISRWRRPRH